MGEWLGLSPVVRGSWPWHNLSAKSTLNQVTGTPTLHDSDAWLLSVTGGPGNEHRQGVEALEGGGGDIQASGKQEEATCSVVKHCKHTGLRQAPPVTRSLSDPISAVLDWKSICLQLLCPHHHRHHHRQQHLTHPFNHDAEKQDKRTLCFSGPCANRCVQHLRKIGSQWHGVGHVLAAQVLLLVVVVVRGRQYMHA